MDDKNRTGHGYNNNLDINFYTWIFLWNIKEDEKMNKEQTQTAFEAICFMHQRPQEHQEDYIDTYAEEPKE